eukprot:UN02446
MRYEEIMQQPTKVASQEQREHYYDQGYLLFPSLISTAQLEELGEITNDIVERSREITQPSREIDLEKGHCADNPRVRRVAYFDDNR